MLSFAPAASAAPGTLTWLEQHTGTQLNGARGVAVSPDGNSVYVAAQDADAVVAYSRNPTTGALTGIGCVEDTDNGGSLGCAEDIDGLNSPRFIAISPAGDHVYVTGGDDNAVVILNRNTSTGVLTPNDCLVDPASAAAPCTVLAGTSARLDGAEGIAMSATGSHVYVAGQDSGTVMTFTRNAGTGALSSPSCFSNTALTDCTTNGSLANPRELAIAPDDKSVYVASASSNVVAQFSRNTGDGSLSPGSPTSVGGVNLPVGIRVSPDNKHVYVAGVNDDAIRIFSRAPGSTPLTLVGCTKDVGAAPTCLTTAEGLDNAEGVAVSPDNANVYATGSSDNAVVSLSRNTSSGALTSLGCLRQSPGGGGCGTAFGTQSPKGVAVSPDGKNVYVAGQGGDAVAVFKGAPTGGGAAPGQPKPTPPPPDLCTNPSTLLVTCSGGTPGVCGPTGTIFPQCSMPTSLPTVCGPAGSLLEACQPPGNFVAACGGLGTILPECHLPKPEIPLVCGPSSGTILPACSGANNPVTVCGPSASALPQCNIGKPVDVTPINLADGTGEVDVKVGCPKTVATATASRVGGTQSKSKPKKCSGTVELDAWVQAQTQALRSQAGGLSKEFVENALQARHYVSDCYPAFGKPATASQTACRNRAEGVGNRNAQVFRTRADLLTARFLKPSAEILPTEATEKYLQQRAGSYPFIGISGPDYYNWAELASANQPLLYISQAAGKFAVTLRRAHCEYIFLLNEGCAVAGSAASGATIGSHRKLRRGQVRVRKRLRLRRGHRRVRVRIRLKRKVVRRLGRLAGKRAKYVPLRVIISFKAKPRPVVRFMDLRVRIQRKSRKRRRGRQGSRRGNASGQHGPGPVAVR